MDLYKSYYSEVHKCEILRTQLDLEISSFKSYYKDISRFILPRRSRFFVTDVNRGDRRNTDIIDATASLAARTLASGMMTGITSPSRQWFRLAGQTGINAESDAIKAYLKEVEDLMKNVFLKSNLYNVLPVTYGDLGSFGTACLFMEEDSEAVINFTSFLIGSYRISCDKRGIVKVFTREFQMTVRQIVDKFVRVPGTNKMDWTNVSDTVRTQYGLDQYESRIDLVHMVKPNEDYRPGHLLPKYKKYSSLYYEKGLSSTGTTNVSAAGLPDTFLSQKGYDYFPVLAPRWEVAGEDTYGTNAPGMMALGDTKQLQLGEKNIAKAIDQKVKPSMVGPLSLQNQKASVLPGDITYVDEREGTKGFRRLFEIDFDIRELEGKQDQVRQRISRIFYEDLFLMLANSDRRQITAREIDERHEEKLLALGPVMERLNQDLLDPLIENTFAIMDAQGLLPEPPEELQGQEFKIEYVSVMAQAQKLAGIGNIERVMRFAGELTAIDPKAAQKVDVNEAIEIYSELTGAPPSIIVSKEKMAAIEAQNAEQAAAEQQMMEQQMAVDGAKTLSETPMNEDTALNELLNAGEAG